MITNDVNCIDYFFDYCYSYVAICAATDTFPPF